MNKVREQIEINISLPENISDLYDTLNPQAKNLVN
jgi:hypothetical protein